MPGHPEMAALRARLREIEDLRAVAALGEWDQTTYMPVGGAEARGRQVAMLRRMAHERLVDPELARCLHRAEARLDDLAPVERDVVRVVRRDVTRAQRVPPSFMERAFQHAAASYQVWAAARPADDVAAVLPYLERSVALAQEYASFFPGAAHVADPLIDLADEGCTVASLAPLFAELRTLLVPLVATAAAACADDPPPDALRGAFDADDQLRVGVAFARSFGYDLSRGRQDLAPHPFATRFGHGDVRITTRLEPHDLSESFFSTLHEAGHAMYEQGVAAELDGTLAGQGVSAGVHESQSRLWENLIGRSLPFWRHALPRLADTFPDLRRFTPEDVYRAVNVVRPSLIRTDADELTYNLHVIIRFDLELELLEGRLRVADLEEAWNERYRRDLGVVPQRAGDGLLQDVHWYGGMVGGEFQGYTIGNVLSAQFLAAARAQLGDLDAQLERGSFEALHGWLREHVYRHGRRLGVDDLVAGATGSPMRTDAYRDYLVGKYDRSPTPVAGVA